jgi:hypothetical protein
MSDIRNQLQTLTGAAIEASQLSQVGGKVFTNAEDAQGDFLALTRWWMAIHAPTYGQPIPGSAFAINHAGDGAAYAPGTNESASINGLVVTNGDPANPATVTLDIDGAIVHQESAIPSFEFRSIIGLGDCPLQMTNGQTLSVTVTGAAPAAVTVELVGFLTVQG